jgi:hypothetical protein
MDIVLVPTGASPQTVHIGGKVGDKVGRSGRTFVDKAVVRG